MATVLPEGHYRDVLGRLPTGVAVITAQTDHGPVGVACNSFTSVSLEPALVGFFVAKTSETWPHIRDAGSFAANVLGARQAELCRTFASKGADRFAGVDWTEGETGAPRIVDAIAWIECELAQATEAGDHWFVLGSVCHLEASAGEDPLVFFRGAYHQVAAHRRRHDALVEQVATARLPTAFGEFRAIGFRSLVDGSEHLALVRGDVAGGEDVLVRVHSQCRTGDALRSLLCDCGARLDTALAQIAAEGRGVLVYLAQDGRGSDHEPWAPVDLRADGVGAHILAELGVTSIRHA